MRVGLPHPTTVRRHAHRRRGVTVHNPGSPAGAGTSTDPSHNLGPPAGAGTSTDDPLHSAETPDAPDQVHELDPTSRRARAAGGPLDRASYACQCGYLFAASVTTTVRCPHCGATQAW